MKRQVLIIHSAGPQGPRQGSRDFVAHLRKALGNEYTVKCPKMPNPESPDYDPWKIQVGKEINASDDDVILIGHSLGGSVLLKYLSEEKYTRNVAGLFVVAAPFWGEEGWDYDAFVLKQDFSKKLTRIGKVFLYHSRDDEVVAFSHLARYVEKLPQATVGKLDGCGHAFNKCSFPELVHDIKSV